MRITKEVKRMALTIADIKVMLTPTLKKGGDKRAWSIPVTTTWVPFFTATNVKGLTTIEPDVLGAPLRLAKNEDGSIKFTKAGRPMTKVHPILAEQVKVARENYEADLLAFAGNVAREMPGKYKAQVELAQRAAEPVTAQMDQDVDDFLAKLAAEQAAAAVPTPSQNGATPAPQMAPA
jgi:hypothetical protein